MKRISRNKERLDKLEKRVAELLARTELIEKAEKENKSWNEFWEYDGNPKRSEL